MVRRLARRHAGEADFDEAVNDGLLAVWYALDSYNDDGHDALTGWCMAKARWAIIDGQRKRSGWRRYPYVEVLTLEGRPEPVGSVTDDPELRAVTADTIRWARRKLSERDAELYDAILSGMTSRAYAREAGVDEAEVCRRLAKIRPRLNR